MRKKWDNYYMSIAHNVAERGTCDRAYVGAVIVDEEKRLVATGYNGSCGTNTPHCIEIGHIIRNNHCIATVHAEQNAIADCARTGKSIKNATIYVTHFPCLICTKLLISSGIKRVCFNIDYKIDSYAYELMKINGIEVVCCDSDNYVSEFAFLEE